MTKTAVASHHQPEQSGNTRRLQVLSVLIRTAGNPRPERLVTNRLATNVWRATINAYLPAEGSLT